MASKSSVHIKPRSIASALLHNARVFNLSYAVRDKSENENKLYKSPNELKHLLRKIKTDYQRNSYRGRKMPSNATPIREAVINLQEHHTLADVEKVAKKIAKKMGVEILGISVHRDEGKDADNINYHAHILFNYYNFNTHKMVHHLAKDRIMHQVQDIAAKELGMERGTAKEVTGIDHVPHHKYGKVAEQKEKKEQEHIKTVTELKTKLNELSVELRTANGKLEEHQKLFNKDDYAKINALKKKLKKNTLDEVAGSYYLLYEHYQNRKEENDQNRAKNDARNRADAERTRARKRKYDELNADISKSTEADISRATKAYKAKREARRDITFTERIAESFDKLFNKIEIVILAVENLKLEEKIKNYKPTLEQIMNTKVKVDMVSNTVINHMNLLKINAENPTLNDALNVVSTHSGLVKDKLVRQISHSSYCEKPSDEWKEQKQTHKLQQGKNKGKGISKG